MNKRKVALIVVRSPLARRLIVRALKNRRVQRTLARMIQRQLVRRLRRS